MCGSRGGGQGSGPHPLKNRKIIVVSINTGLDPMKNHKATKPEFNFGHHRRFAGGAIMVPLIPSST